MVLYFLAMFNPIALGTAKTLWSFGHSECNRVKVHLLSKLSIGVIWKGTLQHVETVKSWISMHICTVCSILPFIVRTQ